MAEGWAFFKTTSSEVGAGELPQLLWYVKQTTTPTPTTPTPTKLELGEKEEMEVEPEEKPIKPIQEKPIYMSGGEQLPQHHPQEVQMGYGFSYLCCPHKEGSRVFFLCLQHIQHGFTPEA